MKNTCAGLLRKREPLNCTFRFFSKLISIYLSRQADVLYKSLKYLKDFVNEILSVEKSYLQLTARRLSARALRELFRARKKNFVDERIDDRI